MTSTVRQFTFDCHDPHAQGDFWANVLGYVEDPQYPSQPDDDEVLVVDPTRRRPGLLFIAVPEPKTAKNRAHLDLVPDTLRDDEVERLLALGATLHEDHRRPDGSGWATLADPEGNEFCVERSVAERGVAPPVDTGERDSPPVLTADERTMLEGMLEWYRTGVVQKVAGLDPALAGISPVGSSTTIAGFVKHLALVEDSWFSDRFDGQGELDWYAGVDWATLGDWEMDSARDEPLADSIALYEAACQRSRDVAAGRDLDDLAAAPGRRPFTLRFAYLHLIEETARHLGHLDLLRELLDGSTGE